MPVRRLARGALALALLAGCGERAGDPVVKLASDQAEPLGGTGGDAVGGSLVTGGGSSGGTGGTDAGGTSGTDAGGSSGTDTGGSPGMDAGGSPDEAAGPTGLCGTCNSSDECGDANDACVRHNGSNFCARDCDEGLGCPTGYTCTDLENSRLRQCVPEQACQPSLTPPSLDEMRSYLLMRINMLRLAHQQAPLEGSTCLDGLAQESALAYARTDEPLGKYVQECYPITPQCSCGWIAEAEVSVAHYGLDWQSAMEATLADDRVNETVVELDFARVGIGFWLSGDEAWIALSFG